MENGINYLKNTKTKIIFVTGGVISGIGKGIIASSIGNILQARGYKVSIQKLDPYLNYDPGVLSPFEHGEVYVTNDGGETDLDLGHYERFLGIKLNKNANYTSGRLFMELNQKERAGFFNGKTVQLFPHFSNIIINAISKQIEHEKPDFFIVEIGGTVGDLESVSFIRTISEISSLNPDKTFNIHATFVPFLSINSEFKTKPTQFSVQNLNSFGIKSNMLFLRTEIPFPDEKIINKISQSLFINKEYVISLPNLSSVYLVPDNLEKQKVADLILDHFKMPNKITVDKKWNDFVKLLNKEKKQELKIAMLGKYIDVEDAYKSIREALFISSVWANVKININWINAEQINDNNVEKQLSSFDGVVVLPGFGERGFEGKVSTVRYTKKANIPTLGICLGMQAMVVGQSRDLGITNATSREFSHSNEDQVFVFDLINKNNEINLGGSLRLGEYKVLFEKESLFSKVYESDFAKERHRHRYEFVSEYKDILEKNNFYFSGKDSKSGLIETCEIKNHKFYLGTQYHPEFNSNPRTDHPLFRTFIKSMMK
ncbi:MAG: CTP synthase [Metamycoplasmataceae bacterium]